MKQQSRVGGLPIYFQGRHISCFYGTSPSSSITTALLTEMLKYLNKMVFMTEMYAILFSCLMVITVE